MLPTCRGESVAMMNHKGCSNTIAPQAPQLGLFSRLYHSPAWLFVVVAFCSVLANMAAIELVGSVKNISHAVHIALDSLTVLALMFPIFLLFFFRPLVQQISERKWAEKAVIKREREFRTLAENSPDVIIRFGRYWRYLYVKPGITAVSGMPAENFIGKTDRELGMPEHLMPMWEGKARQVFVSGEGLTFEFSIISPRRKVFMEAGLVPEFAPDRTVDTVLAISRDITAHRRAEEMLRSSQERLRALSSHLQSSREEERIRIAREIHDELGQVLATVQMGVSLLAGEPLDRIKLSAKISSLGKLLGDSIKTVQRITTELRPHMLDVLGLAEAIEWQAKEFKNRTGIECKPSILLLEGHFGKDLAIALFRIFQETLTNVIRHSGATQVDVRLEERENMLVLVVSDNGNGITREKTWDAHSLGIIGMRERAYALGGRIKIFGAPEKGTTVIVHIPLTREKGGLKL